MQNIYNLIKIWKIRKEDFYQQLKSILNKNMDDDLEPKEIEDELDEVDDEALASGKKKPKKAEEDDSLDALADEEEGMLPEDEFDDVDLW